MTLERAIELLYPVTTGKAIEAFETKKEAVEAITEACMVACDAMYKQVPRKPVLTELETFSVICCPNCTKAIISYWKTKEIKPPHCMMCGQKLDWSEEK